MPRELRSSTSLQVVSETREVAKINSLILSSSSPTSPPPSTSPKCSLKRKNSEIYTDHDTAAVHPKSPKMHRAQSKRARSPPPPLTLPCVSSTSDYEPTDPPSPVPTEIIDIEAEDFVRTAQKHGVKVRDYLVEPPNPPLPRGHELWLNPFHTLLVHDLHIRRPSDRDFCLPGKHLRRLLDINFVTQKEVDAYWTEDDRASLKEYDNRPEGAYPYVIAYKRPKPCAAYRISARKVFYGDPLPEDISDEDIEVPNDGEWEGDEESWALGKTMKEYREQLPPCKQRGRPVGFESVAPQCVLDTHTKPTIFALSVRTPPLHTVSLPETPTHTPQREPSKTSEPSTPTTPPVAVTPTTPTSPLPSASQPPSNPRRLGRTATLAIVSVR